MIRVGDKIGFCRKHNGEWEIGTYLGEVNLDGWSNKLYRVQLESGEVIEYNYRIDSCKDAKADMMHFVGWCVIDKEYIDRQTFECAAWYEDIKVSAGKYPIFGRVGGYHNHDTNEWVETNIEDVYCDVTGTITSDEFGARFGGVPISNYDNTKNAGKPSVHTICFRGYDVAGDALAKKGDSRFDKHHSIGGQPFSFELADCVTAYAHEFTSCIDGELLCCAHMTLTRLGAQA